MDTSRQTDRYWARPPQSFLINTMSHLNSPLRAQAWPGPTSSSFTEGLIHHGGGLTLIKQRGCVFKTGLLSSSGAKGWVPPAAQAAGRPGPEKGKHAPQSSCSPEADRWPSLRCTSGPPASPGSLPACNPLTPSTLVVGEGGQLRLVSICGQAPAPSQHSLTCPPGVLVVREWFHIRL